MNNIQVVKELFDEKKLTIQDGFLTSNNLSKEKFDELFPVTKYASSEFDSKNLEGTVDVVDVNYILDDYHELFNKAACKALNLEYPKVIILSHGIKFIDVSDFAKFYSQWIELIGKVSDHQYPLGQRKLDCAYIFVNQDTLNRSTVLNIEIDKIPSRELEKLSKSISDPSLLLESCLQEDAHQNEKISMMKTSIVELIENNHKSIVELFSSTENLLNNFHKNYETYLRSFSFEDFIKDLEEDVGNFVSKVEEQIQGFYIQALAVPGAVILASALRGVEKNISLALVFSTVLALTIVFRSLKSKITFIDRITKNTLTKLDIYQRRTCDISNDFAKETISEKIAVAIKSVNDTSLESKLEIEKLRDIIIGLICMYAISALVFFKF
jgi:hypothetical protein